jgi:preprotein translocase subunit SecB
MIPPAAFQEITMTSTDAPPTIALLAQYVRDLSFEHPDAPHSLKYASDAVPTVDVEVTYRQLEADVFETILKVTASAKTADKTVAIVELSYGGTYRVPPVVSEMRESFLMVDAPKDLFPFARAIIGLVTQMAGIPPLLIAAPDFANSYRMSLQRSLNAQLPA